MTTTLLLRFPLGRYHATPWGRHVNEGEVEIPPSPWRMLRALYAVWRTRAPELAEDTVHALLAHLSEPPTFHVPRHTTAHTRHYYPDSRTGTDRTLDAFAVFDPDVPLAVSWVRDVPAELRSALDRLAASLPYLGRADSVCEARVADDWSPSGGHATWMEVGVAESVPLNAPATAVLAPELPLRWDTLTARPVDVRREGLLFPVGSRFVGYQQVGKPRPLARPAPAREPVTAVRFSALQTALPSDTDALVYTDLLRQAALSKLRASGPDRPASLLCGRTTDDKPMTDHGHAHYLPLFRDRRLADLVVWIPAGLDARETGALLRVGELRSSWEKDWRLHVRPAGQGRISEVAPELTDPATVWRSVTPLVPSRYPGRRAWAEFIEAEIVRELRDRSLPIPHTVRPLADRDWREFVRYRPSRRTARDLRQRHGNRGGCLLELTFAEPVTGPLTLGFLSHFGLGLFAPVR